MTHTPGPWKANGNYIYGADPHGCPTLLARCPDLAGIPYVENARVMAAAPDLLAACEALLPYTLMIYGTDTIMLQCSFCGAESRGNQDVEHAESCPALVARAAIAKARGE